MFKKIMYKVKENTFRIQDFTKRDNVDESKFVEGKNQRGTPQMQTQMLVLYQEEFTNLEKEIQSLNEDITEKDNTIKKLQHELSTIEQTHSKSTEKIKEENYQRIDELNNTIKTKDNNINTMKLNHSKEIARLKNDIAQLEKKHLQEITNIKLEHQKELNDLTLYDEDYHMKISDHEKALNTIRSNCLKLRVQDCNTNIRLISKLEGYGRFEKFRNKDEDTIKEMREFNQKIIDEDAIEVHYNLIDKDNANND